MNDQEKSKMVFTFSNMCTAHATFSDKQTKKEVIRKAINEISCMRTF